MIYFNYEGSCKLFDIYCYFDLFILCFWIGLFIEVFIDFFLDECFVLVECWINDCIIEYERCVDGEF